MSKLKIAAVIAVLFLGLFLRLHNYAVSPPRGATSDEYSYSFLEISLLTKGVPETWSNVSGYTNRYDLTIRGIYFPMVYPYFDHPPLNGIVVGVWALLNGQNTFQKIDLATIRLVPIFLSLISSVFVFLLGNKLFGYRVGIWALLIYTTATIFVVNQRVVFAENLLTPLLLGTLYVYVSVKKMTVWKAVIIGILTGLCFWAKELGIVVFFTMFFLFFADKIKLRYTIILTTTFLLFFIGYLAYGYFYDWHVFLTIVAAQSDRKIGMETLLYLIANPVSVNRTYYDGWYVLGFLTIFFAFTNYKKYKLLIVFPLLYFLLLLFSLREEGEMGWYLIPLFPFMALSTAALLDEYIGKKNWFIFLVLLFVGLYEITFLYKTNFGLIPIQFRLLLLLLFTPFFIAWMFHKEKVFMLLSYSWFYFLLFLTAFLSYTYSHPI